MTRLQLIERALRIVGDDGLLTEARDALDNVLLEIETYGFWYFLETDTTYQTENLTDSIAFTAAKFPSAAITDFSKGMTISSDEPERLIPMHKPQLEEAQKDADTGRPKRFSIWKKTLYLYPKPVTNFLPLLTIRYFKEISLPTNDSDDLETITGIQPSFQAFLVHGVAAQVLDIVGNNAVAVQYWNLFRNQDVPIMLNSNESYFDPTLSMLDRSAVQARQLAILSTRQTNG